MESQELRIFREVARAGSISKAAGQLGYVQSNVTARIKKLEEELNAVLLIQQRGHSDRGRGAPANRLGRYP